MISLKSCLFQVNIIQHNYDICLLELFLNSSIQPYDDRLAIDGNKMKKGKVCIYYKENISLI